MTWAIRFSSPDTVGGFVQDADCKRLEFITEVQAADWVRLHKEAHASMKRLTQGPYLGPDGKPWPDAQRSAEKWDKYHYECSPEHCKLVWYQLIDLGFVG